MRVKIVHSRQREPAFTVAGLSAAASESKLSAASEAFVPSSAFTADILSRIPENLRASAQAMDIVRALLARTKLFSKSGRLARQLPSPRDRDALQHVLGVIRYYFFGVPNHSLLRESLAKLGELDRPGVMDISSLWTPDHERALHSSLTAIMEGTWLSLFDPAKPVYATTDASGPSATASRRTKCPTRAPMSQYSSSPTAGRGSKLAGLRRSKRLSRNACWPWCTCARRFRTLQ